MPVRPLTDTLKEYGRGLAGGLLFSLPLFYTMEIWWQGQVAPPGRQLAYVGGTFVLLVVYAYYTGLREDRHFRENAFEALEALALGLLVTAAVLALTGRLDAGMSPNEIVGKLVMEGMVAAIGVAVGAAQLGQQPEDGDGRSHPPPPGALHEIALALLGAVLVGANVAPTEEVAVLSGAMAPWMLLLLTAFSFGLVLGTVSYAGFRGVGRLSGWALAGRPLAEGFITYGTALVASAALLWAFGQLDGVGVAGIVGQTVVLALPAGLGAAAGRLLLAPSSA